MSKIGFAITASFCSFDKVIKELKKLVDLGYDVVPIASEKSVSIDTRFGKAHDFVKKIEKLTGKKIVSTITDAERFGSIEPLDLIVVAPATGNFISKLAHGHTDNAVCMAVKATLRNGTPVVIAVSTNDGLGFSGANIMQLINSKNIYMVPLGQDSYEKKPNSLVAHFDMIIPTVEAALEGRQIQPVLKEYAND